MLTNKILLIDDDLEEHDIFCDTLSKVDKSIECVGAVKCNDGFAKLNASHGLPRYIFLDLNMPDSYGKYCFIYTTSNREIDKKETKDLGAQLFITKPGTMNEFKKILSYVISEEWKYN